MRIVAHRSASTALGIMLISAALVTSACGSSSSSNSSASSSSSGGTSVLGTKNVAKDSAVKLGFVSDGQTQALDETEELRTAEATVKYANDYLGGLNGHKIALTTCQTKGTPAGAQDCANQFITDGVPAVAGAVPGQIDGVVTGLSAAGVVSGLESGSSKTVLAAPNTYVWANPLAVFGTPAAYAKQKGYKSASFIVIDVPGAVGPARQLAPAFFKNAGATASVVAVAPGTADMTPQIQTAANSKPDMYYLLGDPTFCSSAMKAIRTLNISTPVMALDRCIGPDGGSSIPGGWKGVTFATGAVTNAGDKEDQVFNEVLKTYGTNVKPDAASKSSYQGMLGLIRAVNASKVTDFSASGINNAIKSMPATPYPLGGGATYQCNGQATAAISKNICSTFGAIATADTDGTLSDFKSVDATGIYKLG
ncbi:MAG: putative branched-chain amino acid transporter, amino acid-binding protein [Frankiales bacterium]|nr:putative branched-chain amino acid transporter, amino acid-binding protein [Frankiales bacterium]